MNGCLNTQTPCSSRNCIGRIKTSLSVTLEWLCPLSRFITGVMVTSGDLVDLLITCVTPRVLVALQLVSLFGRRNTTLFQPSCLVMLMFGYITHLTLVDLLLVGLVHTPELSLLECDCS